MALATLTAAGEWFSGIRARYPLQFWVLRARRLPRAVPPQFRASLLACVALIAAFAVGGAVQSFLLARVASSLTWQVGSGESPRIRFPVGGPFDRARGYSQLPGFRERLENRGFSVSEQSRFSDALASVTGLGLSPPVPERAVAGLVIRDRNGAPIYDATSRLHHFERYEEIPAVVTQALLWMEDQQLLRGSGPINPAVDWGRLGRAAVMSSAHVLGFPVAFQGGSTLAVQMEKFRHSERGRTGSVFDKFEQIATASLRTSHAGPDLDAKRRQIVVDYLNTVPLAGAPAYGEVHGLGEGLRVWFGIEPDSAFAALRDPGPSPDQVRALKHVLALLCAVRAPARLLGDDHDELARRVNFYEGRLAEEGVIDADLARQLAATPIVFLKHTPATIIDFDRRKAADATRRELMRLLKVRDLYELDKLDLEVETSFDNRLQASAAGLFGRLRDTAFVSAQGLRAPRLLESGDPARVLYTLVVFERQPGGDVVRARADNLDQPFDLNSGMRLELGSTAKLRTLAHYLETIELLFRALSPLEREALARRATRAPDVLTAWVAGELARDPGMPLDSLLQHALDRPYSASPYETFFTGGGLHVFHNFEAKENRLRLTVRQAFERSNNLVFIRLMRDIVRHYETRLPYDTEAVLRDPADPDRRRMLVDAADEEARIHLRRAYRSLRGSTPAELERRMLGGRETAPRLAALFFAGHRGASAAALARWLARRGIVMDSTVAAQYAATYGNPAFGWLDYGYILDRSPLEVWCAAELARDPGASWPELVERSQEVRAETHAWLLNPRLRGAQNMRLRTRFERDAFALMTSDWRRLGFPFERLVPSLATAIGSSADRPEALARLVGAILSDGVERPAGFIRRMRFGPGTPYETTFLPGESGELRVMSSSVAGVLRTALAGVVERGTARRVNGAFKGPTGTPLVAGGKTGSGDNRLETVARSGQRTGSRALSRTAAFAFYAGDRCYGVLTATVDGPEADAYTFTSALPLEVVRRLAPEISAYVAAGVPGSPPQVVSAPDSLRREGPARPQGHARVAKVAPIRG